MQAWHIFTHSVRQVYGNLGAALRITAVLYVVQWVIALTLGIAFGSRLSVAGTDQAAVLGVLQALFGPAILSFAVMMVADIWIAVAWHRFVLTGERSAGLVPLFEGRRMLGYFGALLLLFLILGLMLAALTLLLPVVEKVWGSAAQTLALMAVQVVLGALAMRLSTVLAGIALEPGHALTEGWTATRGHMADFLLLSLICGALIAVAQNLGMALLSGMPMVYLAFIVVLQWVVMMTGISIITTLYGYYIEKRALV